MNRDGYKELVFAITSGFPLVPRNVYMYDIYNDSLAVSPKNGYHIGKTTRAFSTFIPSISPRWNPEKR